MIQMLMITTKPYFLLSVCVLYVKWTLTLFDHYDYDPSISSTVMGSSEKLTRS